VLAPIWKRCCARLAHSLELNLYEHRAAKKTTQADASWNHDLRAQRGSLYGASL
jgi:hypothetical protein